MYKQLILILALVTTFTIFSCNDDDNIDDMMNVDQDNDGIDDDTDNCVQVANPNQEDLDQDGIGDECDDDMDGDGIDNTSDNCPMLANADQIDLDGDNIGDVCDDMVSVNITTQIVGSYIGTNKFGEGGSFITEENRVATVIMDSDSIINVTVNTSFSNNTVFDGILSSETQFTTSDVTVLGDPGYAGSGWLSGDSLYIDLTVGNKYFQYAGPRQ